MKALIIAICLVLSGCMQRVYDVYTPEPTTPNLPPRAKRAATCAWAAAQHGRQCGTKNSKPMKPMKNYFKRRREIRLRKWCVEQAIKIAKPSGIGTGVDVIAKNIYDFLCFSSR